MIVYLDTSAAMKLLIEEAESAALAVHLQSLASSSQIVASWLLHAELHCAARRHPEDVDLAAVGIVTDTVFLLDLTRGDLLTAGALPGRLRSADAIHLAAALRVGADEVLTYDTELATAATAAGVVAVAPGQKARG